MPRTSSIDTRLIALALVVVAFALRIPDFGNPVIHVDEQYYLLVGDRMLEGATPYLDIWDRKPIGLFLIYAGIRLLPGDGILAYQIVATLFAAATARVVYGSSRHLGAAPAGAFAAAVAYLLWLPLLGGRGGQAPVFYNLFVAGAARLTLHLPDRVDRPDWRPTIMRNGLFACLLAGLAIQVKYTAAIEGAYFGLAHLYYLHRAGGRPRLLMRAGAIWLIVGIAPTLLAITAYAAMSHAALAAFWFANFSSILLRPGYPIGQLAMRLLGIAAELAPLIVAAWIAWRWRARTRTRCETQRVALGSLVAAVIGFLSIGTYFDHYALPLIAPLAVVAAPAFARSRRTLALCLAAGIVLFAVESALKPDDGAGARAVAEVVERNSHGGCPYVFIGDTITYELAGTCLPSAYAFPNFLAYNTEQGAIGIDEAAEVRRILARRPPVVVTSTRKLAIWNRASLAILKRTLAAHYRPVFSAPRADYRTIVYLRRDLAFTAPAR